MIFLDLDMPVMTGDKMLMALREEDPHTPIYVITAFAPEFMQQLGEARDKGYAFEIAAKPVSPKTLRVLAQLTLRE